MAPRIRAVLNACHDEIKFADLNCLVHISIDCSLVCLSEAKSAFNTAKYCMHHSQYKKCLEQGR